MKTAISVLLIIFSVMILGCQKKDDLPPTLTLLGGDSINHVLNSPYNDPGATATDERDGNITSKIYIDSQVNIDKIGEYLVTYSVVDEAGNEARPIKRYVFVYNQGYIYSGYYSLKETQLFPQNNECQYNVAINVDSTINFGLSFSNFACSFNQPVFAQVNDTTIILPFQFIGDSLTSFTLQGNGYINDSIININYTLNRNIITELWNSTFERTE
jgi:hypothetical protein